ncbi:MAG: hypothetical protein K2X98_02130 [Alphaproteobacteria bacterium]|nr:hypothetical protein [Alphaproteobacteria bacterium]
MIIPPLALSLFVLPFTSAQAHEDGHTHHTMHAMKTMEPTIKVVVLKICDKDGKKDKKVVRIKLTRTKDNTPVTLDTLKEVHTEKIHLLIIDDTLRDYTHVHPKATDEPGVYTFDWHPKTQGSYRMWADLFPLSSGKQEYALTDLVVKDDIQQTVDRTLSTKATINNYSFTLSFDTPQLTSGKAVMGKISITNTKGEPAKNLEPIMGAFAHIVGFSEDMNTVVHMHPMGEEPTKTKDRGGPDLQFHMEPTTPGFIKLFAQLIMDGKEMFIPFGIYVK